MRAQARKSLLGWFGCITIAIVLSGMMLASTGGTVEQAVAADAAPAADPTTPPVATEEVPELRSRRSRTYRTNFGGFITRSYTGTVNFRDGSGEFQPVDNGLVETADASAYRNKANAFDVELPKDLADPVRVERDGAWATFELEDADGAAAVSGSRATYGDAVGGGLSDDLCVVLGDATAVS